MKIIVGISGASGVIMGMHLLRALHSHAQTHLVITEGALTTLAQETELTADDVRASANVCYDIRDFAAPIASGTFAADGMAVVPCSMKTLAGIAGGYSDNLLLRAADVTLKEGCPLVLVPREMPFSRLHLKNMLTVAEYGATVMPPLLTFYNHADTVEKQIDHIIGKIMGRFGLTYEKFRPWR